MQAFSARASLSGTRLTVSSTIKICAPRAAFCVEAKVKTRTERNRARHRRVRNKVSGTSERPRLAVFRSHRHIHAQMILREQYRFCVQDWFSVQVIDDTALDGNGTTLAAVSTLSKVIRENDEIKTGADKAAAEEVGKQLGALCLEKGIKKVVFDRGGFLYFGRVQALADGAREAGLEF